MSKLDDIKAQLLATPAGGTTKIHERDIAEALVLERRPMYVYPSADMEFRIWCAENGFEILYLPASDYFEFHKLAQDTAEV